MKTFYSLKSFLSSNVSRKTFIATVGVFDGFHRAHKKIIKTMKKKAGKEKTLVITFDPHPSKVIFPYRRTPLLLSLKHRLRLMSEEGVDAALVLKFDKNLASTPMADFIKNILGKARIKNICVGSNFFFGKNKKGNPKSLTALSGTFGYTVTIVRPVKSGSHAISSTRIRRLIKNGKLSQAEKLLGRPVSVLGTVVEGRGRGRNLGFPTANINPHHEAIPPSGVYVVRIKCGSKVYGGILNIGTRPTFHEKGQEPEPIIEAHIFNFSRNIYDEDLEIEFVKKIRSERKFTSAESLTSRIRKDMIYAKKVLRI